MKNLPIANFLIGEHQPLAILSGPCVIESEEFTLRCAETLKKMMEPYPFHLIFKASYDKANRSSFQSFRGPGLEEGLRILEKVQKEFDLPVVTDVHTETQARAAGSLCEMIQIPAFLCRQTDLIAAAAQTPAAINLKKGQFLSPWEMKNVVEKCTEHQHFRLLLTDRGTSFGYNQLVCDLRSIPIMKSLGFPACFDATHSAQLPGGLGYKTGGQREFIPSMTKAAIAAGANALFLESHPSPEHAKSDAATVLSYEELKTLLQQIHILYEAVQLTEKAAL